MRPGEFKREMFDGIWSSFTSKSSSQDQDISHGKYLTLTDVIRMIRHNRDVWDFFGWFATAFEFAFMFLLLGRGYVSRDEFYSFYDGSIFFKLARERMNPKQN